MALDIVYGYQGKDHVKASQLARLLSGTIGEGRYVLGTQNAMAATMQTANKVRIGTGDLVMDGRYITNEAHQELTVDSGQSGYNRNDLVGVQYSRASGSDADHSVETVSLVVKKGTQTTGDATDPSYTAGDIAAGDASAFYPLWRLPITGLNVGTPVKLFEELEPYSDFRDSASQTIQEQIQQIQEQVQEQMQAQAVGWTPNASLLNYNNTTNCSRRMGDLVFLNVSVVLASATNWSSDQVKIGTVSVRPSTKRTMYRSALLLCLTDGEYRTNVSTVEVDTDGSVRVNGGIDGIMSVNIPCVAYEL